jgi:CRP-like cAMP-binding protein
MEKNINLSNYFGQIKKSKIFRYLGEEDLKALLSEAEIVEYPKGYRIISQGEISEYLYVVMSGSVDVTVDDLSQDIYICKIEADDVFGEAAIFMTEKRTANVVAAEDCVVVRIHRADILFFIKKHSRGGIKILMLIIDSLLNKLRSANMEIVLEKQSYINLDNIDPLIRDIMVE